MCAHRRAHVCIYIYIHIFMYIHMYTVSLQNLHGTIILSSPAAPHGCLQQRGSGLAWLQREGGCICKMLTNQWPEILPQKLGIYCHTILNTVILWIPENNPSKKNCSPAKCGSSFARPLSVRRASSALTVSCQLPLLCLCFFVPGIFGQLAHSTQRYSLTFVERLG